MSDRYFIRCDDCGEEWSSTETEASHAIVEHNDQCAALDTEVTEQ